MVYDDDDDDDGDVCRSDQAKKATNPGVNKARNTSPSHPVTWFDERDAASTNPT